MPDTIPWFNDLPIAVPACTGGTSYGTPAPDRCWKRLDEDSESRCQMRPVNDAGLCEEHLREMRVEATA